MTYSAEAIYKNTFLTFAVERMASWRWVNLSLKTRTVFPFFSPENISSRSEVRAVPRCEIGSDNFCERKVSDAATATSEIGG